MTTPAVPPAAPARVVAQTRHIAADHPAFDGHFPGQPILPGVCLLAEVMAAWQAAGADLPAPPQPLQLASAKFLSPVGPGAELAITLTAEPRQLRFAVRQAGRDVASGAFSLVPA